MKTWTTVDKSSWPKRGPWDTEPDKAQWIGEAGLDCLIVRNHGGALCGYVGVPPSHPLFEKSYNDAAVSVHGGLTFADRCADTTDESQHICHIPQEAMHAEVWWFGFDCSHYDDLSPSYNFGLSDQTYKSFDYVKREVEQLAQQLKELT